MMVTPPQKACREEGSQRHCSSRSTGLGFEFLDTGLTIRDLVLRLERQKSL